MAKYQKDSVRKDVTYPKLPLLSGIGEPNGDAASWIIPAANHSAVKAFDDLFGCCSGLKSRSIDSDMKIIR